MLQYTTGFLISGSTALSFFTRQVYNGSDLDLYIEARFVSYLVFFLESSGYSFEPYDTETKKQSPLIVDAVEEMRVRVENEEFADFDGGPLD